MQIAKQFSVRLVNKPGRLASLLAALTKEKVATEAFCVMDTAHRSTLRFVPDDPKLAASALDTINVEYELSDVLLVEVPNQPGGLRRICQRLAEEHLNIDYTYGSLSSSSRARGANLAVIKVNNLIKAQRVLDTAASSNGARPKRRPGRRPAHAR